MDPNDTHNIPDTPDNCVRNADGDLGIYDRGDYLRVVSYGDGTSLDIPKSLANVLAWSLIGALAEPSPPYMPKPRVVHQPRRRIRHLSEGITTFT